LASCADMSSCVSAGKSHSCRGSRSPGRRPSCVAATAMGWKWRAAGGPVQIRPRRGACGASVDDIGRRPVWRPTTTPVQSILLVTASPADLAMGGCFRHGSQFHRSAMSTGRPERRTLRVQVPVRELEARRRKGSRAVRGRYSIMRLSIAPRVQSRSRSREPGSLAGTPKPKTPRLTA
jgi:hypothetical protein